MSVAMKAPFVLAVGVVVSCLATPVRTDEPKTFGAGLSLTDVTPIVGVIASPAAYEGKTIRVEGTVTAVCQHMGCWMALAPMDPPPSSASATTPVVKAPATLRLKVDDGVIVFPVTAKGRRAAAQGVVERVKTGDAEGNEAAGEHARAEGKKADAAAQYHIKVTGAVVY